MANVQKARIAGLGLGSKLRGIFPASNELVFFKRHHTEVVSDRVAEVFPFVRKDVAGRNQVLLR